MRFNFYVELVRIKAGRFIEMTVREKEEKSNSSNAKIVEEMKKGNVEDEEEEINLRLKDMNIDQLEMRASNSRNQIEKVPINEESERPTKRSRITESTIKKEEEEEEEFDSSELGKDPLLVTEEILLKYYDFIDYIYHILKDDEQKGEEDLKIQWQKWSEILEKGKFLVKDVNRSLKLMTLEMEVIESIEDLEKQYRFRKAHIPNILSLLQDINSRIEFSTNFSLVSDIKNRRKVLPMCLRELERSRHELSEIIDVVQVLKQMDLKLDDDDDDDDEQTN
ncbi:unnamed protein product [Citrullus colocynthis]|uniref:Uncharacterized protein n=1 Tax=Citrullus colocynthis TaxID=252529 RepID=A0ABP0Y4D5_9ROSI